MVQLKVMQNLSKYDKWLYYEIFVNQEYKPVLPYLNKIDTFFDIWAYKWFFSLYLLKNWFDKNLIVVEPIPQFLKEAKNNISNFARTEKINIKSIKFINAAIKSKYSISNEFYISLSKPWQSWYYLKNIQNQKLQKFFVKNNKIIKSKSTKTLDINKLLSFWKDKVGVKLDIEWEEIFLLLEKGRLNKVDLLIFEYHLFNSYFESLFEKWKSILKQYFSTISFYPSKYTDKIGICLATKI